MAGTRSVELKTTGWTPAAFHAASAPGSPFQVKTLPLPKSSGVLCGCVEKR
jgi:hypothetical protein